MSTDEDRIIGIITGLADLHEKVLSDLTIHLYLEELGGYSPDIVGEAAKLCIHELGFMPRPFEITKRINRLENEAHHRQVRQDQLKHLPEPPPTDEDRAYGSFVCKAFHDWRKSGFVQRQRDNGTFVNYDMSLFDYIAEQKMDEKMTERYANAYPQDPRRKV